MSQKATPATQNDMTTCLETFEKEMFCGFPHRHGDVTGKPETRAETRGCKKTSISCETSSKFDIFHTLSNRLECHKVPRLPRKTTWQPAWKHAKRRGFPASPIDTATPQENQRLETRHVGAPKRSFRTRLPAIFSWQHDKRTGFAASPIHTARPRENQRRETRHVGEHQNEHFVRDFLQFSHFVASKSTFSYEFSLEPENLQPQNRCFVRGFRQFSAHVTKCHACHGICTLSPLDAALPMRFTKNTQQDTSRVLRLPRKMTMDTSKVLRLPRKLQHIWKRHKSIAPATQNDFRHVAEHVWMSRSATPATRNEATTRLKTPKMTTSAELHIGTAIRTSYERLRTVADGCERLRTVANGCGRGRNVERTHPQPPDPQSETGTLATHSGKDTSPRLPYDSWDAHPSVVVSQRAGLICM